MTNTIDNRTVQMDFENKKFESGVQDSLKSIDSLKKGLNFSDSGKSLSSLTAAIGKINLGPISDGVQALTNRFSLMGIAGITVIQDITRRLIGMAEQIARTFVVDPIKTGLEEYETKLNSVQTILANTQKEGTNLKIVTDALNILNEYADKTIYNFKEMTRNIGTFTAAGVKLDTSVAAIKGIANLAAISGSNAQQASTAMYQLSQALSSGTVKLMDWNSVVNAGMGGQVFQDAIKETARLHGVAIDQMIEEQGSFRETLQEGWFTSEILTETLSKFTGDLTESQLKTMGYNEDQIAGIIKMGQTANDAATKVKTLTQLNDTLKEAAQSGWAQTWELIVGDFEEAKVFFTDMSNVFGGLIGASADSRNALISGWDELGGRVSVINIVKNTIQGVLDVLKPITEAMKEIFPPVTAQQLANITKGLENLTEKFKIGAESADKIKRVFKGVFALLDIGRMLFVSIGKSVFGFSSALKPVGKFLEDITLNTADYIVNLRDGIKRTDAFTGAIGRGLEFIKPYIQRIKDFALGIKDLVKSIKGVDTSNITTFLDKLSERFKPLVGLKTILQKVILFLSILTTKAGPIFSKLAELFSKGLTAFLDTITKGITNFDPNALLDIINSGLLAGLLLAIKKFVDRGSGVFGGLSDILDGVKGSLEAWQNSLKANTLLKIAVSIGILAVSLLLIASIDGDKLTGALGAMTAMFVELFAAMTAFNKVSVGVGGLATMAVGLIGIATALLIMAGAVSILGQLDSDELVRAMIAVSVMIALLQKTAAELARNGPGVITAAIGLSIFAVALNIMAKAIEKLGNLQTGVLTQGLIGIAILLTEISLFLKASGGSQSMILAATSIVILSTALLILSGVIAIMGSMPLNVLAQGLIGIALALGIVAAAMYMMPPDMLVTSAALVIVAGALFVLAQALKVMGGMSWEEVAISLVTLAASLTILGIAMSAMTGLVGGAAALLVAAVAIGILALSLKLLGGMSLEEIGLSLLAIAGVLTVLGVAAAVLTPLLPSLLGLALVLVLIGVAALATGVGVLALSIGLTALAAAGAAGATALVLILTSIASLLPMIAKQLGLALITLIKTVADGAPILLKAIVTLLLMIVEGLVQIIPEIVKGVLLLVSTLLTELAANLPTIIQAGYDILLAFLSGVEDNVEDIIIVVVGIIKTMITTLGQEVPVLVDAGWKAMIEFIDGMAEAAEENIPQLMAAMERLGISIIKGVLNGIWAARDELLSGVAELAQSIIDQFANVLRSHSPSDEFIDQGGFIVRGLVGGLKKYGGLAFSASRELAKGTVSEFSTILSKISDTINTDTDFSPTIRPVVDLTEVVKGKAAIDSLVSNPNLNLGVAVNRAKSISTGIQQNEQPTTSAGKPKDPDSVTFVQNNYSPKELSRIDIYRQTRNQLRQAKGIAGAS